MRVAVLGSEGAEGRLDDCDCVVVPARHQAVADVGEFGAHRPLAFEDVCGMRFDFVAFAVEGLEIARAIKRALPHWTVLYWDDSVDWFLARDPRSYDPARSEYEVTLTSGGRT